MRKIPEFNIAEVFGLSGVDIGVGKIGTIAIIIGISILVIFLIGLLVFFIARKRTFNKSIFVWRLVGNTPTRVAILKAKSVPIGRAGDELWFIGGVFGGGIKKYLPPGTIQSAPNEYWYWIREDGEWINFGIGDLDKAQKEAGVKYIDQDMRMQRLATDRLLEQRLMQKSFWEKWGTTVALVLFFIVIAVSLTIYMYMYGKIVDKTSTILDKAITAEQRAGGGSTSGQLVPIALGLLIPTRIFRRKRKWP